MFGATPSESSVSSVSSSSSSSSEIHPPKYPPSLRAPPRASSARGRVPAWRRARTSRARARACRPEKQCATRIVSRRRRLHLHLFLIWRQLASVRGRSRAARARGGGREPPRRRGEDVCRRAREGDAREGVDVERGGVRRGWGARRGRGCAPPPRGERVCRGARRRSPPRRRKTRPPPRHPHDPSPPSRPRRHRRARRSRRTRARRPGESPGRPSCRRRRDRESDTARGARRA